MPNCAWRAQLQKLRSVDAELALKTQSHDSEFLPCKPPWREAAQSNYSTVVKEGEGGPGAAFDIGRVSPKTLPLLRCTSEVSPFHRHAMRLCVQMID